MAEVTGTPAQDFFSIKAPKYDGVMPEDSLRFLASISDQVNRESPRTIAGRIASIVEENEEWRRRTALNLMAAENAISASARRLLDSDFATRVTEGFPGAKEFPPGRHNRGIDEIEGILIALATRLFRAKFIEWRASSTTMANAVAFWSLTKPGDDILVQSMEGGANMNYQTVAIPRLRGLHVHEIPPHEDFGIDVDEIRSVALRVRPKLIVIGGSQVLFPYPLRELRALADSVGARILYDAAHVGLLIATGHFEDPLAEGVDVLSMGTQKVNGGPVGGLSFTNDPAIARAMLALTFPAFIQTRDLNKYAAAAHALAEMSEFGAAYSAQMIANARALGAALVAEGFRVLGEARGYTQTHQIFVDLRDRDALTFERRCQSSNILLHKAHMCGDARRGVRTGARITVQEVTRQGMREEEMRTIARFIRRAANAEEGPEKVAAEIKDFVQPFVKLRYSFDE